jgi:hypothetical protein
MQHAGELFVEPLGPAERGLKQTLRAPLVQEESRIRIEERSCDFDDLRRGNLRAMRALDQPHHPPPAGHQDWEPLVKCFECLEVLFELVEVDLELPRVGMPDGVFEKCNQPLLLRLEGQREAPFADEYLRGELELRSEQAPQSQRSAVGRPSFADRVTQSREPIVNLFERRDNDGRHVGNSLAARVGRLADALPHRLGRRASDRDELDIVGDLGMRGKENGKRIAQFIAH